MSHLIAATFRFDASVTRGWLESDDDGLIVALGSGEPPRSPDADFDAGLLFEAGDFNAHSHPEQSLYADLVDRRWDLATWCRHTIYRFSPYLGPCEIGLGCLRAFSRSSSWASPPSPSPTTSTADGATSSTGPSSPPPEKAASASSSAA